MSINPALLPGLAWFVHIARHRSFTKAATEMEISRAALSQHLKGLEQQLNVRLLHRTTRDMSLTEEGRRLFEAVAPALKMIDTAVAELSEVTSAPTGLIRVNSSRIAARTLLEPHLGEFLSRYPGLRLELVLNDGFANIIADGADVGIRLGESLDEHMVAVPITPRIEMAIVGSPAYFNRHGIPQTPADLVQHNCLAYRFTSSGTLDRWAFTSPEDEAITQVFEPRGSVVFNDDESMFKAAVQGVGLIKYLDVCVREQLASGELVRVLQPWCQSFPGFYLYAPTRAQMPAKVRALIDFLVEKRGALG
ncbi:LysR family transcriptional regulator [Pseudomonas nitroreducens]|uniref:LysR family transcriptional regulator n=1 Tax=Pseudomonas nitroreducens TaxID=46680 RepID=UPI00265ABB3A|nr:LysR family transcriptional regulator [Pseudomonas nitroreducens]MCP1647945.1 DNA-binding transcriptional LysR family regulator [Pseudomonas nitroreducens]MCP1686521.1 DNA-binding transcriptional LysR family regulator [Pseudomonas nitroreducens]